MKQYEFISDRDESGYEMISISNKPKRRLDIIPRFVCLLVATVIWLWIVNFNVTDVTETMVLSIQIEGIESLENKDMMIYGYDKKEITVTVKGSNRDLKKYKKSDYKVSVDVSGITDAGQYTLPLSIVTPDGSSLTLSESEIMNVSFFIDFVYETDIPLTVVPPQDILDQGSVKYSYEHSFDNTSNTKITIKGAKSQIENIKSARFNIDGSFALTEETKIFSGFMPTFYDGNSVQVIVNDGAIMECSTDDIQIVVNAMEHKRVPVYIAGKDGKQATVEIWGPSSVIKTITECRINVSGNSGETVTYTITSKDFSEDENITIHINPEDAVITISLD